MLQVVSMPAVSEFTHGPARIGTNGGTTSTVHPQATGLEYQFHYHSMVQLLLLVLTKDGVKGVQGMHVSSVGVVRHGSKSAPLL